jgi:hypothetical protein
MTTGEAIALGFAIGVIFICIMALLDIDYISSRRR